LWKYGQSLNRLPNPYQIGIILYQLIRGAHSINNKKYIDNVIKVSAIINKADTLPQMATVSKLIDLWKEEEKQKIVMNKTNQNPYLNIKKGFDCTLIDAKIKMNSLYNDFPDRKNNVNKVSVKAEKVIPQNSINMCIKCINFYALNYTAKLLEVNHIKPKLIDTYIISDLSKVIIWPLMENKNKKGEVPKHSIYLHNNQVFLFFIKLFNNIFALPMLTFLHILRISHLPFFLIKWIISDKNQKFFLEINHNNKWLVGQVCINLSLLKNFIVNYLDKIADNYNYRSVNNSVIRLPPHKELGIIKYNNSLFVKVGESKIDKRVKSDMIHLFKIEGAKFMQLLNIKSFSRQLVRGKGELKLFDRFKVEKWILEGKLWNILNLYLTNNDLSSYILDCLKKQALKDYNLTKKDLIEPEMLSLYQDQIHNITYQSIFKILSNEWHDIKWIISFKFDTVFLDKHRNVLIKNIKENISHDYLFLTLISNMFNMDMVGIDKYNSLSRYNILEYDKLSEFLINIFFCKLDNKVNDLKYNFFSKYYNLLWLKFWNLKLKDQNSNSQMLAHDVITKTKFNFKYIRYLDTFILGINGTKPEVNEIRNVIDSFLKLELQLNNIHSNIVDIHNDNFKFMNINISTGLYYNNKFKILFLFPKKLIIKALINSGIINSNNIPICKKNLLKYNLNIIINTYIDINTFILSSFVICHDFSRLKRFLSYYINCSLKLTLQAKLENKYWIRVVSPVTPLIKNTKIYDINNSWKFFWQKSIGSIDKREGQLAWDNQAGSMIRLKFRRITRSNFNILLLFRLGLISSKILKKLYYFRVNNKKYLKRKYVSKNYNSNVINFNWESNVNFDFLITNYFDFFTLPAKKSKSHVCTDPRVKMKIISMNNS
jgi:hypothetical protein